MPVAQLPPPPFASASAPIAPRRRAASPLHLERRAPQAAGGAEVVRRTQSAPATPRVAAPPPPGLSRPGEARAAPLTLRPPAPPPGFHLIPLHRHGPTMVVATAPSAQRNELRLPSVAELRRTYGLGAAELAEPLALVLELAGRSEAARLIWRGIADVYLRAAANLSRHSAELDPERAYLPVARPADALEDLTDLLVLAEQPDVPLLVAMLRALPWRQLSAHELCSVYRLFSFVPAAYRPSVLARLLAIYAEGQLPTFADFAHHQQSPLRPVLAIHLGLNEAISMAVADRACGRTPVPGERPAFCVEELSGILRDKCQRREVKTWLASKTGEVNADLLRTVVAYRGRLQLPSHLERELLSTVAELRGCSARVLVDLAERTSQVLLEDFTATPALLGELLISVLQYVSKSNYAIFFQAWTALFVDHPTDVGADLDLSVERRALLLLCVVASATEAANVALLEQALRCRFDTDDQRLALSRLERWLGLRCRDLPALVHDTHEGAWQPAELTPLRFAEAPPPLVNRQRHSLRAFDRAVSAISPTHVRAQLGHLARTLGHHARLAECTSRHSAVAIALRANPDAWERLQEVCLLVPGLGLAAALPRAHTALNERSWRRREPRVEASLAVVWRRLRALCVAPQATDQRAQMAAVARFIGQLACLDTATMDTFAGLDDYLDALAMLWASANPHRSGFVADSSADAAGADAAFDALVAPGVEPARDARRPSA